MMDYRHVYRADFRMVHRQITDDVFGYILQAVKPSRVAIP